MAGRVVAPSTVGSSSYIPTLTPDSVARVVRRGRSRPSRRLSCLRADLQPVRNGERPATQVLPRVRIAARERLPDVWSSEPARCEVLWRMRHEPHDIGGGE